MKYNHYLTHLKFAAIALPLAAITLAGCKEKNRTSHDVAKGVGNISGKGYTDTSSSSVRVFDQNGRVCVQQSNTSYEMATIINGKEKIPVLLKIKKTELCFADSVNKDKVYEIQAKSVMDTKPVGWQTAFVATDIALKDNTVYAVKEGNDTEHDLIRRYSLANGAEVFACSFGELTVRIPGASTVYFAGYTSKRAASNPIGALNDENLIGVIRFGSNTAALDSVKIKLKRSKVSGKLQNAVPDASLVALNDNVTAVDGTSILMKQVGENPQLKDIQDFGIKLAFFFGDDNETTNITIPIVAGKLDLAHAEYDKEIFDVVPF